MPYIGKSPEMGVRTRYYYTVSAGATSVSGSDDNSKSLTFSDGEYVDVYLNGVSLVAGTDYNTTTANTIAGLSAMSANDVVEVIVYDVFSVFSGDISGDLAVGGNSSVTGTTTLTGNVGIGASSSSNVLDVTGANSATVSIIAPTDNATLELRGGNSDSAVEEANLVFYQNNAAKWQFGNATDNSLKIYNYATSSYSFVMDATGAVTKPLQPAFSAKPTSQIDNLSVGGSDNTHVVFGTERFDTNADYNTSTGVFTAPVTGKYLLCFHLRLENIDTATTTYDFILATSNIAYTHRFDPDFGDSDTSYYHANLTVVADMDASDTANVEYYVDAGTAQTDIDTNSYFMGYLLG